MFAQALPPTNDGAEVLSSIQGAFEALVDRIGPSVVAIEAQALPGGPSSSGSGFVIRADGTVLTSEHVVAGAVIIHVVLPDGKRYRGRHLASDRRRDLATIRIDANDLKPVEWGDAAGLRRGSLVLAFGNPLTLCEDGHAAASFGLVSAMARPLPDSFGQEEDRYYGDMIQTTAAIGPGFSGGPLVDIHGRVVGVMTVGTARGAPETLGFTVPINSRTRAVIECLLEGSDVEYGYLGVQVRDAKAARGALLQFVYPDGAADGAGLVAGDIIVAVDDEVVLSADQLVQIIGSAGPGAEVRLDYLRSAERRHARARLTQRAPVSTSRGALPSARQREFRGATMGPVQSTVQERISAPAGAVIVLRVAAGSAADRAGLTPGDIIVRVNGKSVTPESAESLARLTDECLLGLANGGSVLVKAER